MVIKSLKYSEHEGDVKEWVLNKFNLNKINLIIGKNASGKSRTLKVIYGIARLILEPKLAFNNGDYSVEFETDKGHIINYELRFKNKAVTKEVLTFDGEKYVDRTMHGKGTILNKHINTVLDFKIPKDEVVVTRRDSIQYPYLEKLYEWANDLVFFEFNTELGKKTLAIVNDELKPIDHDLKETDKAIALFRKGLKEFGDEFKDSIINDFNSIGYDVEDIDTGNLVTIKIETNLTDKVLGFIVKERDREGVTDQHAMSMGMFRSLAIIIYFNYFIFKKLVGTVMVDDIGEGLDFERSSALIKLLIDKCNNSKIQLFLSTNDRFVMNNMPLEYWQIISRKGSKVNVINHENSTDIFSDFKFTGLSNFDFFSSNFYQEGFKNSN